MNNLIKETNNYNGLVEVWNDQVVTDSRKVAEVFEKEHKHVIKAIENIKAENSALTSFFYEGTYKAGTGKSYKMYYMNRDGLSLLVMGFTGKKALGWKLRYIEAFNAMEKALQRQNMPSYQLEDTIERAKAWIREEEERRKLLSTTKKQEQLIGELKPKADYTDTILQNKGLIPISQIAKEYGMSAQAMNKKLHEMGIQYKCRNTWLLYEKYANKGYTHSKTHSYTSGVNMSTQWTQRGRKFLYEALKAQGILPTIEAFNS